MCLLFVDSVPAWGDDEVDNERDDTDVVIIIRNIIRNQHADTTTSNNATTRYIGQAGSVPPCSIKRENSLGNHVIHRA